MSDSDSDLGWLPGLVRRVARKASHGQRSQDVDTDEESLYETMPQKLRSVLHLDLARTQPLPSRWILP